MTANHGLARLLLGIVVMALFAATAAHGSGDDNWYVAELTTIDAQTGAARPLYKPPVNCETTCRYVGSERVCDTTCR